MITLKNIVKSFETVSGLVTAVDDVSLEIADGQIFGIIGFSGAGKSTLVRCINLLEKPTSGAVAVDGQILTGLSEKELRAVRKKIGMIFQHFNLLNSRTVSANIAYPLRRSGLSKEQIGKKVQSLLELVGLSDKALVYPSQLSGGQKQRVAIARALANDPKVLLCDEATSALDPQTTQSILSLLQQVNEKLGITIVLITHEMAAVKEICHQAAVMEHGKVIEQGDVYSVFSSPIHKVTQEFVLSTFNIQKINTLIAEKSPLVDLQENEVLIRLNYLQSNVAEAIVSTVSRKFNVDVNIISGNIEIIQGRPMGGLVAIISGAENSVKQAVQYYRERNVKVEVIADGKSIARTSA